MSGETVAAVKAPSSQTQREPTAEQAAARASLNCPVRCAAAVTAAA
jgi:hypothetical protein